MRDRQTQPAPAYLAELRLTSDHPHEGYLGVNIEAVIREAKKYGFTLSRRSLYELSEEGELRPLRGPCNSCGRHHRGDCAEAEPAEELVPVDITEPRRAA